MTDNRVGIMHQTPPYTENFAKQKIVQIHEFPQRIIYRK